jgi:hypothetical protein
VSLPPIDCTREPPYEQLLVGVVAGAVSFGGVVGPLSSSYEVASTREPPHEQWLTGMGAGAGSSRRRRGVLRLFVVIVELGCSFPSLLSVLGGLGGLV